MARIGANRAGQHTCRASDHRTRQHRAGDDRDGQHRAGYRARHSRVDDHRTRQHRSGDHRARQHRVGDHRTRSWLPHNPSLHTLSLCFGWPPWPPAQHSASHWLWLRKRGICLYWSWPPCRCRACCLWSGRSWFVLSSLLTSLRTCNERDLGKHDFISFLLTRCCFYLEYITCMRVGS